MDAAVDHPNQPTLLPSRPFIAADVGGTHARVALVSERRGQARRFEVLVYREYVCADYRGLPELLAAFLAESCTGRVQQCVLACAGQVSGDAIINDNLVWPISLAHVRKALAFDDVAVLNDFEALGYALDAVRADAGTLLCGPDHRGEGPTLVVGPGTGLGAAVRLDGSAVGVLTSEAGQADFAPASPREREVLACLAPAGGYVPCERLLSGPGLLTLYGALCRLNGRAVVLSTSEAITAAACARTNRDAVETVDLFGAALGGFVGNLAMTFMASGGVYLAGGFLSRIRGLLMRSTFAERFLDKGSMRTFLERVPVRVIEHGRHGVLGAARWYVRRRALA